MTPIPPQSPRRASERAHIVKALNIRERAHEKLDEAFDMYLDGHPLMICTNLGWLGSQVEAELRILIGPWYK